MMRDRTMHTTTTNVCAILILNVGTVRARHALLKSSVTGAPNSPQSPACRSVIDEHLVDPLPGEHRLENLRRFLPQGLGLAEDQVPVPEDASRQGLDYPRLDLPAEVDEDVAAKHHVEVPRLALGKEIDLLEPHLALDLVLDAILRPLRLLHYLEIAVGLLPRQHLEVLVCPQPGHGQALLVEVRAEDPHVPRLGVAGQHLIDEQLSLIHISEPTRLGMISYAVFCLK